MAQPYRLPPPPPPVQTRLSSPIMSQHINTVDQQDNLWRPQQTIIRRRRPNIQVNRASASTDTEGASENLEAAINYTNYFLERQHACHADHCIFLCWKRGSQSDVWATDVPIGENAVTNEINIFKLAREYFYKKHWIWHKFFYTLHPIQTGVCSMLSIVYDWSFH